MSGGRSSLLVGEDDVVETNMDDLVDDVYREILLHLDAVSAVYLALSNKSNSKRIKDILSEPVFNLMLRVVREEDEESLKRIVYSGFFKTYYETVQRVKNQNKKDNAGLKSKSNQIKLSFGAIALLLMTGVAYLAMSGNIKNGIAANNFFALVDQVNKLLSDCEKMFCKGNATVGPNRWCLAGPPTVCHDSNNGAKTRTFGCDEQLVRKMFDLESNCHENELARGDLVAGFIPLLPILVFGGIAYCLTTWKMLECLRRFDAEEAVNKFSLDVLDFTSANAYFQQEIQNLKGQQLASVTGELEKFELKRAMVFYEENADFKKMLNRFGIQLNSTVGQAKSKVKSEREKINKYAEVTSASSFGIFLEMKKQINHTVIPIPNENTALLKSGHSF